ncbi:GIY-YIG nuclease family protein [Acinetobacter sp. Marseille-Q1618]|uniref:GIY-YIG nuclease family protein n=1 Tax=Acinetobacter sp. Marseille-Q1618 TaxID=2697502 RepID=UPI00156E9E30|nr:GIY-YIG nuclease family protein [Acinetobacter sp. Marseille-Q1618]
MNVYTSLLQLRPDLEKLQADNTLPIEKIKSRLLEAMKDKMVLNYQDDLSLITLDEKSIANFDQNTILAFLTSVIRTERFIEGELSHGLRSGLVLRALERLAVLVNIEHKVMLNDILQIKDLDNVKIRLNFDYGTENWNVIEAFKNGDMQGLLRGHYWNYKGKKSYKKDQTTIGLLRIKPKEDLWLLFHIGKVTKDLDLRDAMGYEFENLIEYNKFVGRVIVKYKNTSQSVVRNASSLMNQCEVYQILPDIFDNDIFPGYDNVNVSWKELSRVIEKESWKTALQNQKAVYLITDIHKGKMYVGSASGQHMLLNRWQCYVDNGHGGNVELKKLSKDYIEENFRYSILDIFKSKTDDQIILSRESWWKNILLTRKFGYNAN